MTRTVFKAGDLIGHRRDGRPVYLIGGGAPTEDEQDATEDTGSQDHNADEDDGDTDLLGDDDTDVAAGENSDDDNVTMSADEIRRLIADEANRVADRRINQALETRKRRSQRTKDDPPPSTATDADVREARLVYREYVADAVKFTSTEERDIGANLARSIVAASLAEGSDVEQAGQEAARKVADQMKALRARHQRQVIDQLKQRGVIPKDYQAKQSTKAVRRADAGTSGHPVETSDPTLNAQYGENIAKRLFPQNANQ